MNFFTRNDIDFAQRKDSARASRRQAEFSAGRRVERVVTDENPENFGIGCAERLAAAGAVADNRRAVRNDGVGLVLRRNAIGNR